MTTKTYDTILTVDAGRTGGAVVLVGQRVGEKPRILDCAGWRAQEGYSPTHTRTLVERLTAQCKGRSVLVVIEPAILGRGGMRAIWSIGLSAGPFCMLGDYSEAPNGRWQADVGVCGSSSEERKASVLRLAPAVLRGVFHDDVSLLTLIREIAGGQHHLADASMMAVWAVRRMSMGEPPMGGPGTRAARKAGFAKIASRVGCTGGPLRPTYVRCDP